MLSDHKPLEIILRKPMSRASPRLQRMMLQLQKYTLDVQYTTGKEMYVADTLSRAAQPLVGKPTDGVAEEAEIMVCSFIATLSASDERLEEIRKGTLGDEELLALKGTIKSGWPGAKSAVDPRVAEYWNIRDELYEADGILFKGQKIIVPQSLRKEMLARIHEGHLGEEKCKERARAVLYWPGMAKDIEDCVAKCATCLQYRRKQQSEPMLPHPAPARPWQKVGSDIMTFQGRDYLVVVDYYSKYAEIVLFEDKTASWVVRHMKSIYARHGIPEEIVCDNMPYGSREFREFGRVWGIKVTTSSPTYAQSNGLSERTVQTLKQLLRKASHEGKDMYLGVS